MQLATLRKLAHLLTIFALLVTLLPPPLVSAQVAALRAPSPGHTTPTNPATHRLGVYAQGGCLNVRYGDGTAFREPTTVINPVLSNTWYVLSLAVDNVRGQTVELYPEGNPSARSGCNVFLPSGKTWHFHGWSRTGTLYVDDYREFNAGLAYVRAQGMKFTYDSLDRLLRGYTQSQGNYLDQGKYDESYTYNAIGNITSKGGVRCTCGHSAHKHAVTSAGSSTYSYDRNGNVLTRPGQTLAWDAENRLASVTQGGVTGIPVTTAVKTS